MCVLKVRKGCVCLFACTSFW